MMMTFLIYLRLEVGCGANSILPSSFKEEQHPVLPPTVGVLPKQKTKKKKQKCEFSRLLLMKICAESHMLLLRFIKAFLVQRLINHSNIEVLFSRCFPNYFKQFKIILGR